VIPFLSLLITEVLFKTPYPRYISSSSSMEYLDENFEKAVILFEDLLKNAKPDQEALNSLIARTLKQRMNNKSNKSIILQQGMYNYAVYGKQNKTNLKETDILNPQSNYGLGKYFCEQIVKKYCKKNLRNFDS
jgi:hypothetical protein